MRKRSNTPQAKLERSLWELCRSLANRLWATPTGRSATCYTCDRPIRGSNKQLGHFIPKASGGALLKYNMLNLRWQCYNCNINLGGNGAEFYKRLVAEFGDKYVDNLFTLKQQTTKSTDHYEALSDLYTELIEMDLTPKRLWKKICEAEVSDS